MKKKIKYAVLKMNTEVGYTDFLGIKQTVKLAGCAGYMPIFNTEKQAKKIAGKKYKIVALTV